MENEFDFRTWLNEFLIKNTGLQETGAMYVTLAIQILILAIVCWVVWLICRNVVLRILQRIALKTKSQWDDIIMEKKVFNTAAHIIPALIVYNATPYIFGDFPDLMPAVLLATDLFIVLMVVFVINSLLSAVLAILMTIKALDGKPVASFVQMAKLLVSLFGFIIILSILIGQSPIILLSGLGAVAAILIIVFRDTILGLVASIQISAYDMVRVGDWISMPKYDADGDVVAITLNTVQVQNWNKTISTIPAYALISDSFTNWRGMQESGGRRIKRALHIKVGSIKFCSPEMIARFKKYHLVSDYIDQREAEIAAYNAEKGVDKTELINGRHMTNIGIFRRYTENYLLQNPNINKEMTCMVRQLEPGDNGLPIEIYCFSADKRWIQYEGIIADIFDHLLAAASHFELEIFQSPTGTDFSAIVR